MLMIHESNFEKYLGETQQANQGQLSAAVEDFRHALDLDPGSRNAAAYLKAVEGRLQEQRIQDGERGGGGRQSEVPVASAAEESAPKPSRLGNTAGVTQHQPLQHQPASIGGPCAAAPDDEMEAANCLKRSKGDDDSSHSGHSSSGEGSAAGQQYCTLLSSSSTFDRLLPMQG